MIREKTFRLSANNSTLQPVDIPVPTFGYTVQLHMALAIQRFDNNVDSFDRNYSHDYRTVDFTTSIRSDNIDTITSFLRNQYGNDNEVYTMTLSPYSGFYPAGADMGDSGDFTVSILSPRPSGAMRIDKFGYINITFRMVFHNLPMQAVPTSLGDATPGSGWTFGAVHGLRDPSIMPEQEYAVVHNVTMGGGVASVRSVTHEYTTKIKQSASTQKMAELINCIQRMRGYDIPIITTKNFWLFGADNEEHGDGVVRLLTNNFIFTHADIDQWEVVIPLWRKGRAQ